jgi:sugar/nucleoside kinase (ribokinase family)
MRAKQNEPVQIVVVGSVAIDTIKTPWESRVGILGGSASYACAAASFFAPVGMVGVVGTDFPQRYRRLYRSFGINLDGLQSLPGKTFRWTGIYEKNMDVRRTVCTELNVFASFQPDLPPAYRRAPFLFLANIAPDLQLHVLSQIERPRFVMADTMDLWINTARDRLKEVIRHVDLLTLNESEAHHLTGKAGLVKAAIRLLGMGPKYVLIKKGEHGSALFSDSGVFLLPAYPLLDVKDPTGAGDSFAGGLIGWMAERNRADETTLRNAMLYGSVVASFGVEDFSLDRLARLSRKEIERRAVEFRRMLALRPAR